IMPVDRLLRHGLRLSRGAKVGQVIIQKESGDSAVANLVSHYTMDVALDSTMDYTMAPFPSSEWRQFRASGPNKIIHTDSHIMVGGWFRVIMSLTLASVAIYGALRLGCMLSADNIIQAYVSQWRVELRNLQVGPDPASFGIPSDRTRCLTFGSDGYVNISFVVSFTNNPSWLEVYIESAQILEPDVTHSRLRARTAPFKGDGEVIVHHRVPSDSVRRLSYISLWNITRAVEVTNVQITLAAQFSLFGYKRERQFHILAWAAVYNTAQRKLGSVNSNLGMVQGVASDLELFCAPLLLHCYWAQVLAPLLFTKLLTMCHSRKWKTRFTDEKLMYLCR
ncbi:hypothetical protein FOL47_003372, partial [Perkinsus chesapeaki]